MMLSHVFHFDGTGVKSYEHAQGAAGALGWRLSADQVSALDKASDDVQVGTGLPFENW